LASKYLSGYTKSYYPLIIQRKNKSGNEKLRALGLEVFDSPLSQFLMGGSYPYCLSFELIRE